MCFYKCETGCDLLTLANDFAISTSKTFMEVQKFLLKLHMYLLTVSVSHMNRRGMPLNPHC